MMDASRRRRRRRWCHRRVARGLTQRDLADLSGVRQADISRIERGAGNPTESTFQRLAAALDSRLELVPA